MYEDVKKDRLAWFVLFTACVAVFMTAFEVREPILSAGPIDFTVTETAAALFIASMAAWALAERGSFVSWRLLDLAVLLFLVSNFLSVVVATDKGSALKFSLRMVVSALLYLGISRLPSRSRAHLVLAGTMAVTLMTVVIIGLMQSFIPGVNWQQLLSPWQEGVFTFGAFYNLRISSTLPFPTSLAMYIELTLPFFIAMAGWLVYGRNSNPARATLLKLATISSLAAIMLVLIYTYTRSALVAVPVSLAVAGGLSLIHGLGKRIAGMFFVSTVLMFAILGFSALLSNATAARLGISEQVERFKAEYTILKFPDEVKSGQEATALVHIKNTSNVAWVPDGNRRVLLSYRWFKDGIARPETSLDSFLPHEIQPGEEFDINVRFAVPEEPGRYLLAIDLLQIGVGWFSTTHVRPAILALEIGGGSGRVVSFAEEEAHFIWFSDPVRTPSRTRLWRAAYEMWKDHPLLGVGPDQFRTRYGEYLTDVPHDARIRTNNIYLEAASTTGIAGLASMLFMLAAAMWQEWRLVSNRSLSYGRRLIALALISASVAYVLHGVLDNFLWQNGITYLFFTQLGLTSWLYYGMKKNPVAREP